MIMLGESNRRFIRPLLVYLVARRSILPCLIGLLGSTTLAFSEGVTLENNPRAWQDGWLHIHHISTGRGDSALLVLPDKTTLLIDAGELHPQYSAEAAPLITAPPLPDSQTSSGTVIAEYIRRLGVERIDYALITHFDADHYGHCATDYPDHCVLTGIREVASLIPIDRLIDRGYPDYDFPADLLALHRKSRPELAGYIDFVHTREAAGQMIEQLIVGSNSQISLQNAPEQYPTFEVRNVKSNNLVWTGQDCPARQLFSAEEWMQSNLGSRENPFSLALRVTYGRFEYFTGGDLTGIPGLNKPELFDVETPVAEIVGEVDVTTLNHHGNRSSTNINFLRALQPRVIVQQSWISDHPGSEVVRRIADPAVYPGERDVFATYVNEASPVTIGRRMTELYESYHGHVVVRVEPGGGRYWVDVLDDRVREPTVLGTHGPYHARDVATQ